MPDNTDPGYDPYNTSTRLRALSVDFTPDAAELARRATLLALARQYRAEGRHQLAAIVEQEAR